jgi:glycosyltransferase involved in cell wall biosynthesis
VETGRASMFSIIVPTFNRASSCLSAVQSVLMQDASVAYEIIVVDNNSTDETRERIGALCRQAAVRVRYVFEPRQGASAARNAGIAAARGDIIAHTVLIPTRGVSAAELCWRYRMSCLAGSTRSAAGY